jgi:hypothetical protein
VVGLMFLGWALIEALRNNDDGNDTMRVRQRLYELERDPSTPESSPDPLVLSRRWARSGSACTSTDGGCFLIVDRVAAAQRSAFFTVRVDGLPVYQGHALRCGETLNLPGRSGTYNLHLWAVDGAQAAVSISLRMDLGNLSANTGD